MNKYRIQKYHGLYIVQVLTTTTVTTGMLWWKQTKTIETYVRCNMSGYPLIYYRFVPGLPPLNVFGTLKDAQHQIDVFLSPTEIIEYPPVRINGTIPGDIIIFGGPDKDVKCTVEKPMTTFK